MGTGRDRPIRFFSVDGLRVGDEGLLVLGDDGLRSLALLLLLLPVLLLVKELELCEMFSASSCHLKSAKGS